MTGQAPLFGVSTKQFEKLGEVQVCQQMFDSRCLYSDAGDLSINGKILTAAALLRGSNISAYQVETTISSMTNKNSGSFVEWIPDNMMTSMRAAAWAPKYGVEKDLQMTSRTLIVRVILELP